MLVPTIKDAGAAATAAHHLYNDATNQIATELDTLHQQLAGAMSPEQRDWFARLADRLRGIGKDPADPVPVIVDPRAVPHPTPARST